MYSKLVLLGAGSLAQAASIASRGDSGCNLQLSSSGSISDSIGQLSSGQARAGSGISAGTFTLTSEGSLIDSKGRGSPTYTLQCDEGQNPEKGFSVGCDGEVSYNGQTTFYECFGGVAGQYNFYLGPNGFECGEVTLHADSCKSSDCSSKPTKQAPPPAKTTVKVSPPPAKTTLVTMPKPSSGSGHGSSGSGHGSSGSGHGSSGSGHGSSGSGHGSSSSGSCPTNLSGSYQFPHLILPLDSGSPSSTPSSSYFGEVSSTVSSVFDFDIPSSYSGKTCSLVFLFPEQSQLETSSYTFSGSGEVSFSMLSSPAVEGETSYDHCPSVSENLGTVTVAPGNSYVVSTFSCQAGERVGYEMTAEGDTSLRYFQDYNPSPIGLYITACVVEVAMVAQRGPVNERSEGGGMFGGILSNSPPAAQNPDPEYLTIGPPIFVLIVDSALETSPVMVISSDYQRISRLIFRHRMCHPEALRH
ncbi:Ubiquitin 3 binding protein But2 [Sarocladium implicatum]|nr:Ubiquitin 3 binding protein But2 [Sarocladium implicatum]